MDTDGFCMVTSVGRKHIHIRHFGGGNIRKVETCGEVVAVAIKESTTTYNQAPNFESRT